MMPKDHFPLLPAATSLRLSLWLSILLPSILLVTTLPPSQAQACPAYTFGRDLPATGPAELATMNRDHLRLFALQQDGRWSRLPLQIDPLDAELLLRPADDSQTSLSLDDRLVLRTTEFGRRYMPNDKLPTTEPSPALPCQASFAYELKRLGPTEAYAYLVHCPAGSAAAAPVSHDAVAQVISSPMYRYQYLPKNQLIFRSLQARDLSTGKMHAAAGSADMLLHLDIKKFFSMNFSSDDVQSYVESSHTGELGVINRVQFYLSILFFKVDLKLATMASYFADAAHLPMVIDVPLDAPKRLHPGSGMLFAWQPAETNFNLQTTTDSHQPAAIPMVNIPLIKQGAAQLGRAGEKHCRGPLCVFRLHGRYGQQNFIIDMQVARELVQRGFYPQWVEHQADFRKDLDWPEAGEELNGAANGKLAAVYFETSGLAKGRYTMDYWIRLSDDNTSTVCPAPIQAGRRIAIKAP